MAHWVAAQCLRNTQAASYYLGRKRDFGRHRAECDAEMVKHVQGYVRYVRALPGRRYVEVSFTEKMRALDPDFGGTADAVVYDTVSHTLHVVDFKYGAGVEVEAEGNTQLLYYALGARLAVEVDSLDKVVVHIYQPRHWSSDVPFETWEFDPFDVVEFMGVLVEGARRTRDPNAPVVPGDHCRWCDAAAGACPEGQAAQELVMADELLPVEAASVEQIAQALEILPLVEKRCKAIRERAYTLATGGVPIPGFKLVDKTARRKWVDEATAAEFFHNVENAFTKPALKSPAQVESELGKKQFEAMAAHLVTKVSSGTALVPESDKRPPTTEAIEAMFEVIPSK